MDLTAQGRVVFDTAACIYYLERPAADPRCAVLLPVVRAAQAGTVELVISTVTVTELLTGPLRVANRETEAGVRLFSGLLYTVAPVDIAVAERAAALCSGAVVVGNDSRWKQVGGGVTYLHIDDLSSDR
ncbi:MAG: hypothetical protein WCC65_07665 [Pseudonocardiaceae bacterium]